MTTTKRWSSNDTVDDLPVRMDVESQPIGLWTQLETLSETITWGRHQWLVYEVPDQFANASVAGSYGRGFFEQLTQETEETENFPFSDEDLFLEETRKYLDRARDVATELAEGPVEFGKASVQRIPTDDDEKHMLVTMDVTAVGATREEARKYRRQLYSALTEELPPSALSKLALFVSYRAEQV